MKYEITIGERKLSVEVRDHRDGGYAIRIGDGPERRVSAEAIGRAEWLLRETGAARAIGLAVDGDRFDAQIDGHAVRGAVVDARRAALEVRGAAAQGEIRTQMPGAVVRVPVSAGQAVHEGQVLVVVEAMKMENEFKSPIDGVVASIAVAAGQTVEANTVLIVVTAAG